MSEVQLLLIRHGMTDWNEEGRIQGHIDIALNARGEAALAGCCLPPAYAHFEWYASPLRRAVATARLLGGARPVLDARLREMNWGAWEGRRRDELRARSPASVAANEARGLDFRPPGGETPRELQARFLVWCEQVATRTLPVVAVTHKGVLKAALGLASGWGLTGKAPHRLRWERGHLYCFDPNSGALHIERLNISLTGAASDTP